MDARSVLERVMSAFRAHRLEVILIGNSAAAIQGAPVTTDDLDFMFRDTPINDKKLKSAAADLGGLVTKPHYPISGLRRFVDDESNVQIDVMGKIHGVKSFESLRSRAEEIEVGSETVLVASLEDIIKSKKAAGRPKDLASLPAIEDTLDEIEEAKEA